MGEPRTDAQAERVTATGASQPGIFRALSPEMKALCAAAAVMPLGSIYFPLGLTWLALAVALGLAGLSLRRGAFLANRNPWIIGLFVLFLAWCALSSLWSIDVGRSVRRLPDLAAVLGSIVFLVGAAPKPTRDEGRALALALAAGFALALPFLFVERFTGTPLMHFLGHHPEAAGYSPWVPFKRGVSVMAVLAWPAMVGLATFGHRKWAGLLAGAVFASIWLVEDWTVLLSFLAGGVACALVALWRRPVLHLLRVAATLWIFATPFLAQAVLPILDLDGMVNHVNVSVLHRLYIWRFSSGQVVEHPLLGFGADTARSVPGGHKQVVLSTNPVHTGDQISLHTHNVPLQVWLELGVGGASLAAAFVWVLFSVPLSISGRAASAFVAGELVTGFAVLNGTFGAWQVWWQAGFALAALFTVVFMRTSLAQGIAGCGGANKTSGQSNAGRSSKDPGSQWVGQDHGSFAV